MTEQHVTIRPESFTVAWSPNSDRSQPISVFSDDDEDALPNLVHIFPQPLTDISRVTWYKHDSTSPYRVTTESPFDLEGAVGDLAVPTDINALDPAIYEWTAVIDTTAGNTYTVGFTVRAVQTPSPDSITLAASVPTPTVLAINDPNVIVIASTILSVVTTPTPTVNPTDKIAHGVGRLQAGATLWGPAVANVPKPIGHFNMDHAVVNFNDLSDPDNPPYTWPQIVRNEIKNGRVPPPGNNVKSNLYFNLKPAWGPSYKNNQAFGLARMQEVAAGMYDDIWAEIATDLRDGWTSAGGTYYQGYPNAIVRIGWEHNLLWHPWYTNGRSVAEKRTRGMAFAAAMRQMVDVLFDICPTLVIDLNYGDEGADTSGGGGDGEDRTWNPDAWPGDSYVDTVGLDIYARSGGRNRDHIEEIMDQHIALAAEHGGKPVSYGEIGVTLPLCDGSTTSSAGTDATCAPWLDQVLTYVNGVDLAFWMHWAPIKTSQGYRYRYIAGPADCSHDSKRFGGAPLCWDVLQNHMTA